MESSSVFGLMGVLTVSASVALLARQVDEYLLSDFMKKLAFELGGGLKSRSKKMKGRVQFGDDVIELSLNNKDYQKQHVRSMLARANQIKVMSNEKASKPKNPNPVVEDNINMPLNRLALYKGIMEYKAFKGYFVDGFRNRIQIHGIGRPRIHSVLFSKTSFL